MLVFNYSYEIPGLSQKWDHVVTRAIFDNWQVSGVTTLTTGTYGNLTYSYSNVPTGALAGTGAINGGSEPGHLHVRSESAARRADIRRVSSGRSASRRRPISSVSAPR